MENGTVSIILNGKKVSVQKDASILDVAISNGVEIPHVCYQPNLGAVKTCDTCIVKTRDRFVRACSEDVSNGMEVDTLSHEVKERQKEAAARILHNHELYCTVCENNNGDCAVHNAVKNLHIDKQKYPFKKKPYEIDDSNPFYIYDPNQCILCGRCVEACQDVQVNETLSIDWSRDHPRVVWDNDVPAKDSSCVSCGHCVTVCPVNALMEKNMLGKAGFMTDIEQGTKRKLIDLVKSTEPHMGLSYITAVSDIESQARSEQIRKTKTVCTYCGVGCSFDMWTRGREILKVQPQPESPANGISTCVKGKFGWEFVNSSERLKKPLIRKGDHFVEASWEEAITRAANGFKAVYNKHGKDSLQFIASSKGTNEEAYLVQKLARQVFGTNNVDNSSRFCQAPATTGLWRTVGYGGDAGSIKDIHDAELVIAVGTNTAESHPVLATRIKRAHKLNGQKLIVSDLREHEMARRADVFLHPKPGTDIIWLSAVSKYIIDHGWEDTKFISERVNGFDEYRKSLEPFTLEFAEKHTDIPKEKIVKVAEMIHSSRSVCGLWAMGITQHQNGSDSSTAISNLLLVTGNYGRPGTGAYPLRGHNNVQGTSDFGSINSFYPGYQSVGDPDIRKKFESAWNCKLDPEVGIDNNTCLEAIAEDRIRAMYVIGEELVSTGADSGYIRKNLEKLDFLVVQDLFLSETAQYADVVLPASASLEKEGTFVNTERRIQRIYEVMKPYADTKPDWIILQLLAGKLGVDWNYAHPSEIMDEISSLTPMFSGVSYERLEGYRSQQWPVGPDGTGTPLLYTDEFHFSDGRARFHNVEWKPVLEVDGTYDLHLNNGRLLEHFHEGNETYRTPGIRDTVPSTFVEISPKLADERRIESGDIVKVVSKWGSVKVKALVTDRVSRNELYMPMNSGGESAVNNLSSRLMDSTAHTPAYKEIPVRIEKLKEKGGETPLPLWNHRNARPNPRNGVEVEKKWKRSDYEPLVDE